MTKVETRSSIFSRPSFTIAQIAAALNEQEVDFRIFGTPGGGSYSFKSLRQKEPNGIFFAVGQNLESLHLDQSIVISDEVHDWGPGCITLQVAAPQVTFYRLMELLVALPAPPTGIHPTAVVSPDAEVSPNASIGPYCVLERCRIGAGVVLHSFVVVMDGSDIEDNVRIGPHTTIGATGVAWAWEEGKKGRVIQPQVGYTCIGEGSFLGSDVSVVRGSVNEATIVGARCMIAHGSKIGHGSMLGTECHLANNISIGGNVTLGDRCFLGSGATIRAQVSLAPGIVVGTGAVVVKNCAEEGSVLMGSPAAVADKSKLRMGGVPRGTA